jgi:hypothetical protein
MRPSVVALVFVAISACASHRQTPSGQPAPPSGSALPRAATPRAITNARISIDSGVRVGSLAPLLAVIDDSTRIVMPSGDTLDGRERIVAALLADSASRRIASFQLSETRYQACTDGAIEWGARYFIPLAGADRPDTLRGPYAVRWIVEGDGSLRVRQLMLGPAANDVMFRRACTSDWWNRYGDRRFTFWVPVMVDRWATVDDLSERFGREGYGSGHLGNLSNYRGTESADPRGVSLLGLRYQMGAGLSIDLLGSISPTRNTIQAYKESDFTHVSVTQQGQYYGGMLAYAWRYLRVGAGPLVVTNKWSQREIAIDYDEASDSWFARSLPAVEEWRSADVGVIAQGSVLVPVTSFLSIEGFAHYRAATTEIRDTGRRRALKADVGGRGIGFALGVGF